MKFIKKINQLRYFDENKKALEDNFKFDDYHISLSMPNMIN